MWMLDLRVSDGPKSIAALDSPTVLKMDKDEAEPAV
jgi:hypothetical protein